MPMRDQGAFRHIPHELHDYPVQRKALTPNDFPCLEAVAERLYGFQCYYESIVQPFAWKHGGEVSDRVIFGRRALRGQAIRIVAPRP